jgi:hypothetical protein
MYRICLLLAVMTMAFSNSAHAGLIEVDFQGTVAYSGFSSVSVGDTFTGSFFYSSPDVPVSSDPNYCVSLAVCDVDSYSLPQAFEITVDGSTITTNNLAPAYIQVEDSVSAGLNDRVDFNSGGIPLVLNGPIAAQRSSAFDLALISFAGSDSVLDSPQLPEVFPGLGQWSSEAEFDFATYSGYGGPDRQFYGNITSLTSHVVPEPSTLIPLAGLILAGLRHRRSTSRPYMESA